MGSGVSGVRRHFSIFRTMGASRCHSQHAFAMMQRDHLNGILEYPTPLQIQEITVIEIQTRFSSLLVARQPLLCLAPCPRNPPGSFNWTTELGLV